MSLDTDSIDNDSPVSHSQISSKGRKHPFFQRSDSTLFIGCPQPDPFTTPLADALPLADKPHILQPNSRREELFGIQRQPVPNPPRLNEAANAGYYPVEMYPTRLGLSTRSNLPPYPTPANVASYSEPPPLVSIVPTSAVETDFNMQTAKTSGESSASPAVRLNPVIADNDSASKTTTKTVETTVKESIVPPTTSSDNTNIASPSSRAPIIVSTKTQKTVASKQSVIVMAGSATPIVTAPESFTACGESSNMDTSEMPDVNVSARSEVPTKPTSSEETPQSIPTLSTDPAASNDNVSANVTVETSNYSSEAAQHPSRPYYGITQQFSHDLLLGMNFLYLIHSQFIYNSNNTLTSIDLGYPLSVTRMPLLKMLAILIAFM